MAEYGIFLAKWLTVILGLLFLLLGVLLILAKNKLSGEGRLKIENLNEHYEALEEALSQAVLSKKENKKRLKAKKEKEKTTHETQARMFVLDFVGDMRASSLPALREAVTALLSFAKPTDEIVLRLESPGGLVHAYGLAASQLDRIRQRGIPLTVCVDKVAASGGYLMACVADKIVAAPFAVIGSIGVLAQLPNFHRFLKKRDIDFEQVTAGKFKRTLTVFGENTEADREKMKEELELVHESFKSYITEHRKGVPIDEVATGEHWLAAQAKSLNLVDELMTSDDYLMNQRERCAIYQIKSEEKKPLISRIIEKMLMHWELSGWKL